MKKVIRFNWIIKTVIFIALFGFLFIKCSYLLRPVSINRENIVGYYAEEKNIIDIVLIGGSSTYVFWAPYDAWENEGFVSYDFSTDAMSPALLKGLISEAEKTQSPQLYVIDLRALDVEEVFEGYYSDAYIRNITDSLKYSANRNNIIKYVYGIEHPEEKVDISKYWDICLYHNQWQEIGEDNYKFVNNNVSKKYKGFRLVKGSLHKGFDRMDWDEVDYELPLSDKSTQILRDLLEYCRENDINALFTLNPIYRESADTKARYNYVGRIVSEYGYEFIDTNDYYDEMNLDFSRDFYNENHVNYLGAEKYTRFLSKYIADNYEVSDRRGDSRYNNWLSDYDEWENECIEQKKMIEECIMTEVETDER